MLSDQIENYRNYYESNKLTVDSAAQNISWLFIITLKILMTVGFPLNLQVPFHQ